MDPSGGVIGASSPSNAAAGVGSSVPATSTSGVVGLPPGTNAKIVIAVYPFTAIEPGDLTLDKNDEYIVLDDSQVNQGTDFVTPRSYPAGTVA